MALYLLTSETATGRRLGLKAASENLVLGVFFEANRGRQTNPPCVLVFDIMGVRVGLHQSLGPGCRCRCRAPLQGWAAPGAKSENARNKSASARKAIRRVGPLHPFVRGLCMAWPQPFAFLEVGTMLVCPLFARGEPGVEDLLSTHLLAARIAASCHSTPQIHRTKTPAPITTFHHQPQPSASLPFRQLVLIEHVCRITYAGPCRVIMTIAAH